MSLPVEFKSLKLAASEKFKRQRQIKAQLITPVDVDITVLVGKQVIKVNVGQQLWLPHDCLHTITTQHNVTLDIVLFSARVTRTLPSNYFTINNSALLLALVAELKATTDTTAKSHLHQVCLDQINKLAHI